MPELTAVSLGFLLGCFNGVEEMSASAWAPAGSAVSRSEATAEIGGTLVVQHYIQHRDEHPSFEIHAVWMTEPVTGEILYWGFDSAGFSPDPPARGTWHDSDLVLDRTTPRGSSRLVIARSDDGWTWSKAFRASDASDWFPVQRATFHPSATHW